MTPKNKTIGIYIQKTPKISIFTKFGFIDKKEVFDKYFKKYGENKFGYIILGPPCVGKTTFVNSELNSSWIDSDDIMEELGASWHFNESNKTNIKLNYMRCDYLLEQLKVNKMKVIGSLFWKYKPTCIVIPELNVHIEFIKKRNMDINYVMKIRNELLERAIKENIPTFDNCIKATNFVNMLEKNNIIEYSEL